MPKLITLPPGIMNFALGSFPAKCIHVLSLSAELPKVTILKKNKVEALLRTVELI